jgi:plasmid stabilization system protein ParE
VLVVYDKLASLEVLEAAAWYGERDPTLRDRFLSEWRRAEDRLKANPEIYRCFTAEVRKCHFEVFPYSIVFQIEESVIQVIAVMHFSRKPGYWKNRKPR